MALSVFDLFKIGIGPSSSHTVGPMKAARLFVSGLADDWILPQVARVRTELYGSLGATGKGHGSGPAVLLGLEGHDPEIVDPALLPARSARIAEEGMIYPLGGSAIAYDADADLVFHKRESLPYHPNGMVFTAMDARGETVRQRTYYSVGGGFVLDDDEAGADAIGPDGTALPAHFTTADELLALCEQEGCPISELMLRNELCWRTQIEVRTGLLRIWDVMQASVANGVANEGALPGGLKVPRRAAALHRKLTGQDRSTDPLDTMDWVNLYALAVNEENAAGGRIVTAPTNGAAGIVPAVLHYYWHFVDGADEDGVVRFLLTAAAVGVLIKLKASISGADVGCQGEVGSACAMAAAGLAEVMGGTPRQVENAAEIGLEHNLGLTCDPIGGLVQIPCIERNAVASVKAVNAARMALRGDGQHFVSLDKAIRTMRATGADMLDKYKETSRGGLAVNVIEC
ncbi:L-serine ammonia-lyase [Aquisalimonas lutea]|uniref:L-serine ammonia-lyase n=1 Tax=Aquisalimonas lutea TaxID=1327750 RepID=UPI0025B60027|nr:L-serine ammonia-lyase [Aquisalimonas lutea]MDN3519866.1 L-serine ammonia-lyase [Aquisalimonas lutea]